MNRREVVNFLVEKLESSIKFVYGWLQANDESLSKITYMLHVFSILLVFVLIIVSHVIYPVFWFQLLVFIITAIIWLQHIFLHTCICTFLEVKLGGIHTPIAVDPILQIFSIPVSKQTRMGVTLILSTAATLFLGLELVARSVLYARSEYGFSTWV